MKMEQNTNEAQIKNKQELIDKYISTLQAAVDNKNTQNGENNAQNVAENEQKNSKYVDASTVVYDTDFSKINRIGKELQENIKERNGVFINSEDELRDAIRKSLNDANDKYDYYIGSVQKKNNGKAKK